MLWKTYRGTLLSLSEHLCSLRKFLWWEKRDRLPAVAAAAAASIVLAVALVGRKVNSDGSTIEAGVV